MNTPEQHAAFKEGLDNFLNQNKDKIYSGIGDFISDQMMTKEEKEAKAKKKREDIEAREREERERAFPTLADLFNRFSGSGAPVKMAQPDYYKEHRNVVGLLNRTGKALLKEAKDQKEEATAMAKKMGARNPFYHLAGAGFGPDGEYIPPTVEDIKKHYDKPIQPPPVFDDEPEYQMMERYYYSQKAPGKYRPEKKRGGMINPFDKDGNLLPQFQPKLPDSEFDWIENERRTTNPFYHLSGGDWSDDMIANYGKVSPGEQGSAVDNFLDAAKNSDAAKDKILRGVASGAEYLGEKLFKHFLGGGEMPAELKGSGWESMWDDMLQDAAKFGIKKGMELFPDSKPAQFLKRFQGGIAHNPKGHTTRNNNLTKQKPQKKKFCGFKSKVFEHKDYDPAKMHKFRAATCGGPLSHGGRPEGAKNKQGYTKSGEFTERRKQYGESREFRKRIMGQGRQLQLMPDEDDLVSKKENPVVEKIIHEPMDDGDIRAYFPKARVMRYAELADYDDIEELLPSDKSHVFLLYQHRPNDGHFVCLMRYGNTIEFFCSYGSKIDGPLYWTALKDRQALGEGKPYLSLLLRKAGKRFKAVHNPVAFQSKKQGVATCGAYCVMRINQLVNHNQDLHEFIDWMEEIKKETKLSYDEIAANYVNKR